MEVLDFKTALFRVREALIGLEYLLILKNQSSYICSLCDRKAIVPRNLKDIISHFYSYSHQLNFLQTTFPSAVQAIVFEHFDNRKDLVHLVSDLCYEIESRLGRMVPKIVAEDEVRNGEMAKLALHHLKTVDHFKEEPSSTLVIDMILKINAVQMNVKSKHEPRRSLEGRLVNKNRSDVDIEDYFKQYDVMTHRIRRKYLEFHRVLDSHPKYTETWNCFWLDEFYKLKDADRDPTKCDFTDKWKCFWERRLLELEEEEILEMRVKLRHRKNLSVEPADEEKLTRIINESRMRISTKHPTVPVTIKSQSASETIPSSTSAPKHKTIEVDDKAENILNNRDVIFLFKNLEFLDENLQSDLFKFMDYLEKVDPRRYHLLLKVPVTKQNEEIQSVASKPKAATFHLNRSDEVKNGATHSLAVVKPIMAGKNVHDNVIDLTEFGDLQETSQRIKFLHKKIRNIAKFEMVNQAAGVVNGRNLFGRKAFEDEIIQLEAELRRKAAGTSN